ncbi:MAG TPA: hypothetical protein VK839_00505 [Erythrobacter sp.]|nr:hypothetical protein [Erythrobacter sp.]
MKIKILALSLAMLPLAVSAQVPAPPESREAQLTYADLVDLADTSELVLRAEIRRQIALEPERATGDAPGFARLFIEADTLALIAGTSGVGAQLRYLVDVPLDARGKVPKLRKQQVLLFARAVQGRPGELQLASESAQLAYSPELETRLRPVLSALAASDSPPVVTGISDALSVPGNLAGESETQIFLKTEAGAPVSITVLRRPGRPPAWGVSWGEIIDQSARPPAPETIAWYRLACALPPRLPDDANLSNDGAARAQAARDYALVMGELGPCARSL